MSSLIGTKEAAQRLNISVRRVQALIAAGRLAAEKIGKSFAIREMDLKALNGRRNGRPKPANSNDHSRKQKATKAARYKLAVAKPPHERTQDEWNVIVDKFAGSVSLGPPDLSANKKKYLKGMGREKFFRR